VASYGGKARVNLVLLAYVNPVNRRAHVVIDATPRHAAEHPERLVVRVEQHFMRLQQIGPDEKHTAVAKLEMRSLQLDPFAADDRPILAPVELESFPRLENQRYEGSPASHLLLLLPMLLPCSREAATRPYEPANPSETKSACNCLTPRLCLRDLSVSSFSQADKVSANGSSLLDLSGTLNTGSTTSARKYLRIVFRDRLVLREISRIESWSRSAQRRIMLSNSMLITPMTRAENSRGEVKTWVNSQ
jgi:hypothetical protein